MTDSPLSARFVIPVGTQVVLKVDATVETMPGRVKKAGSVGLVSDSPRDHGGAYVVAFVDGSTVSLRQDDLSVRRTIAPEDVLPEREPDLYEEHLIYRVIAGSRVSGPLTSSKRI